MKHFLKPLLSRLGLRRSFHDKAFRAPRLWSNRELAKFAPLFPGDVVNVSAWEDKDKDGRLYRDYFSAAASYSITNFGTDQGVLQGSANELFLDLEQPLSADLVGRFDLVFNHTTLEHVYDFRTAFANMCALSRDAVIIVVPWLQPLHSNYGDYWRFSPQAIARLFAEQGLSVCHLAWNTDPQSSVYVFAVAVRDPGRWGGRLGAPIDAASPDLIVLPDDFAGRSAF